MAQSLTSTSPIQDSLFGTLAVRYHFVLPQQVNEAIELQQRYQQSGQTVPRLGEILAQRGYMTNDQVRAVLKGQTANGSVRFGEVAIALQFCPDSEVESALIVQNEIKACGGHQRLGEILVARGKLRPHQVHAVLQAQGKAIVACPGCKTRLNVSGFRAGAAVSCPRCKKIFVPAGSSEHVAVSGQKQEKQDKDDVRADLSAMLPAVGRSGSANRAVGSAVAGHYQLGEKLGSDHSGVLYKAFDPQTGTNVAVRILSANAIGGASGLERWQDAGEAACELTHPNLQRTISMNTEGNSAYLVMEFIESESLRAALKKRGKFGTLEAIDILIQAAEALNYCHSHNVVHGDLRPAHVLIGLDGIVRLSGMGIPKNVSSNLRQVAGQLGDETLPLYSPPEVMIDSDNSDERSDIYSLGAVGYHMLTGRPPHEGSGVLQVGFKVASSELVPPRDLEPKIAPYVNRLIVKCLQLEPDERYQSVQSLLEDLRKTRQALLFGAAEATDVAWPLSDTRSHKAIAARRARKSGGSRTGQYAKVRLRRPGSSGVRRVTGKTGQFAAVGNTIPAPAFTNVVPTMENIPDPAVSRPVTVDPIPDAKGATDLLEDIDPLGQATRLSGATIPTVGKPEDDADLEAAIKKGKAKKRKVGVVEKPGVSTRTVIIICVVTLMVLGGLIYALMQNPAPKQTARLIAGPDTKIETPPEAPITDPAAMSDWRLAQEFIKDHGQDYSGIVERLHRFALKYGEGSKPPEQVQSAQQQMKQYSALGADSTFHPLHDQLLSRVGIDKFSEITSDVDHWKEEWRWADGTEEKAKALAVELSAKEKQLADQKMQQASQLRQSKQWANAYPIYNQIIEHFESAYASAARGAMAEAQDEERAGKAEVERDIVARRGAEEVAAREAASETRLKQLMSDLDGALKTFDLAQCKTLIDNASELLTGTSKGPDLLAVKNDIKRMTGLRDRMAKSFAAGKLSGLRVTYKDQQCRVLDTSEKGPVVEVGSGKIQISWQELSADDLSEIARRASNPDDAQELMELGILRFQIGKYVEARQTLSAAQRLGANVSKFLPRVEAKLQQAIVKPPDPATVPVKPDVPAASSNPTDPEVVKLLSDRGLEPKLGIWKMASGNIMQALPNPAHTTPNLMSLKHMLKKSFKGVSMEVRGTGEAAGFSFGEGRRFFIKPDDTWQRVTIERKDKEVILKVNGKVTESIEDIGKDVTADNVAAEGQVYIRFQGTKGEFRYFNADE